jgi:hypothetical protein
VLVFVISYLVFDICHLTFVIGPRVRVVRVRESCWCSFVITHQPFDISHWSFGISPSPFRLQPFASNLQPLSLNLNLNLDNCLPPLTFSLQPCPFNL